MQTDFLDEAYERMDLAKDVFNILEQYRQTHKLTIFDMLLIGSLVKSNFLMSGATDYDTGVCKTEDVEQMFNGLSLCEAELLAIGLLRAHDPAVQTMIVQDAAEERAKYPKKP